MMTRMISLVPSRIWCTRRSRTICSMRIFLQIAVAAVQLQRLLATSKPASVAKRLAMAQSSVASGASRSSAAAARQSISARGVELGRHVGEPELQRLEVGEPLAERLRSCR